MEEDLGSHPNLWTPLPPQENRAQARNVSGEKQVQRVCYKDDGRAKRPDREDGQPRDEPLPGAPPAPAAGGTCGEGAVILGPGTGHQAKEDQRGA